MNQYIAVYIPGTKDINHKLPARERLIISRRIARELSGLYGGCTSVPSTGYYVSNDGQLIEERITIIKSYHNTPPGEALESARRIARELKIELSQESVTIESNDGIEFI